LESSPSDDSSNEDISDNENKLSGSQRHQPHPPSAPISEDSRRRRRRHQPSNGLTQESPQHVLQSSKSMDVSILHFKNRRQQLDNEMDSPQADPYGSATSLRPSSFFQSLKPKRDKIPLPRPSSALGGVADDEKQQRKNRRSVGGTPRPARVSTFLSDILRRAKLIQILNDIFKGSLFYLSLYYRSDGSRDMRDRTKKLGLASLCMGDSCTDFRI
jgi:hypothetical protein